MKLYCGKLFFSKKLEKIPPKNRFVIIIALARSRFPHVSREGERSRILRSKKEENFSVREDLEYFFLFF